MPNPTHIYVDIDATNDDTNPSSRPPNLNFEVTRNHPFLDGNAGNYYVTISRFNIQTASTLPVFIPAIESNQNDVNKTVYKISIVSTVGTVIKTMSINYVPSNLNTPVPTSPVTTQDYTSRYYYVNQYQDFINMINNTLKSLWEQQGLSGPITQAAPFIEFDPEKYTCILNVERMSFKNDFYLYFNTRLMQLFTGLPAIFERYEGDLNYKINIPINSNNTRVINVTYQGVNTPFTLTQVYQELSSVGLWNPVRAIVFTSNTLPIYPTQTSPPKLYNSQSTGMTGSGAPNISNILSDFEIPISSTNQYRPEISYTPPGEYRLIDLFNNENLSKIDLNVWWRDKFNNLNAFLLQPGCSADIKLMFRSKRYYLGYDY